MCQVAVQLLSSDVESLSALTLSCLVVIGMIIFGGYIIFITIYIYMYLHRAHSAGYI